MGRRASVRYWATRGTWTDEKGKTRHGAFCCTLKDKQYILAVGPDDSPSGPNFQKATKAFGDLFCLVHAGKAGDSNTCRVVIEYYLRHLEEHAAPKTLKLRQELLSVFCKTEMADWPVHKVTPFAVEGWLSEMRRPRTVQQKRPKAPGYFTRTLRWGDGQVTLAVDSLHAAFNFAVQKKLISENPIVGVHRPPSRSRGRDCIVGPETHSQVLAHTRGQFRELIVCLENSGCRPGELLNATAADWDDRLGAIVYHGKRRRLAGEGEHKTARKDEERRIFFKGDALRIMRERVRRFPRGGLWRAKKDPKAAYPYKAFSKAFRNLAGRLGIRGLSPYSYRHTYATRWLEGGGSIDDLAALMGNTAEVIRKHYAHLVDNLDRMGQLAEKFTAARSESPPDVLPFGKAAQ